MRLAHLPLTALLVALLSACGGDRTPGHVATVNGVPDEQLPTPTGVPGSAVTGMPAAPGPGQVGMPVAGAPGTVALDENGDPLPVEAATADPSTLPDGPVPPGDSAYAISDDEPGPQDAVAVIRDYYSAINARSYAQAFALWSDGGRASGQSPQQFADGFAGTDGVSVEVRAPGRVDAAAGSRYIDVPVVLVATQSAGGERRYAGSFKLRRAVVDGATPEQRAWRIASADLREEQP